MVKCPYCKGCMKYRLINDKSYYCCELCNRYYHIIPGGGLVEVEDT